MSSYNFSVLPSTFIYTDPATDLNELPAVAPNFGLSKEITWKDLMEKITDLNKASKDGSKYKLTFVGRHGQGVHNVAEAKYGTKAWDEKWSLINGDGELTWGPDPSLTQLGIQQANEVNQAWKKFLSSNDPPPLPTKLYSSPFIRATLTLRKTYQNLLLKPYPKGNNDKDEEEELKTKDGKPLRPLIKEFFRETIGEHTCDKRGPKSKVQKDYPDFDFEDGFVEEDELYKDDERETDEQTVKRISIALSQVWKSEPEVEVLGITAHSGVMEALFQVVNHIRFKPKTGALVPMVIKATPL